MWMVDSYIHKLVVTVVLCYYHYMIFCFWSGVEKGPFYVGLDMTTAVVPKFK